MLVNNVAGTFLIKGLAMVMTLFTMPIYIRYFDNKEAVGIWFGLVSVLNWILTFDLGIGNGLRNNLVGAFAEKNDKLIKELISSAEKESISIDTFSYCFILLPPYSMQRIA